MNEKIAVMQLFNTSYTLAKLSHPAHATIMIHGDNHTPLRSEPPLSLRHVRNTTCRTATDGHECKIASHFVGVCGVSL